jgi:hypothetical protein
MSILFYLVRDDSAEKRDFQYQDRHDFERCQGMLEADGLLDDVGPSVPSSVRIPSLVPFDLPNCPQIFTDFYKNPALTKYLKRGDVDWCYCLLCGELLYEKCAYRPIGLDLDVPSVHWHMEECSMGSCTPIIYLSGRKASQVELRDGGFKFPLVFGSIYTDRFGDYDFGLKRGSVLTLNPIKVRKLLVGLFDGGLRMMFENDEAERDLTMLDRDQLVERISQMGPIAPVELIRPIGR